MLLRVFVDCVILSQNGRERQKTEKEKGSIEASHARALSSSENCDTLIDYGGCEASSAEVAVVVEVDQ